MRFHHWLPTRFHDLEASNESRNEICCVGNFGTCLYADQTSSWIDFIVQIPHPSNLVADETTQISIRSNVEASLGIAAGSLMTVRPLLRVLITYFPILSSWSGGEGVELGSRWER
ncbi:hypothetical protein N7455_011604 [Penicillium solitum]|uniref:uncharacterized protein n=1 Tax=Penicillium solitum TaxID=60172 RepID=UPI0032C436F5|nr:hypothetical protein N7455_011604 [Penicillium solitum]